VSLVVLAPGGQSGNFWVHHHMLLDSQSLKYEVHS